MQGKWKVRDIWISYRFWADFILEYIITHVLTPKSSAAKQSCETKRGFERQKFKIGYFLHTAKTEKSCSEKKMCLNKENPAIDRNIDFRFPRIFSSDFYFSPSYLRTALLIPYEATSGALRPCTHEQIKYPLFEQFLDHYEVNLLGFAQINCTLFAHVYAA